MGAFLIRHWDALADGINGYHLSFPCLEELGSTLYAWLNSHREWRGMGKRRQEG